MITAPDRTVCQYTGQIADLEESLANEIPCGGIKDARTRRDCTRPAELRGRGHRCPGSTVDAYDFKCLACWKTWFDSISETLGKYGAICCADCDRQFTSVQSFNDFRPL